jgi:hypothetical protein
VRPCEAGALAAALMSRPRLTWCAVSTLLSRCLVYIAVMRGLLKSKPDALGDIGGLMKKYKGLPRAVLLDLNEKFTETTRGAGQCVALLRSRDERVAALTPSVSLSLSLVRSVRQGQDYAQHEPQDAVVHVCALAHGRQLPCRRLGHGDRHERRDLQVRLAPLPPFPVSIALRTVTDRDHLSSPARTRVTALLQGLGCVIDVPSAAEREALGLTAAEARGAKRAALKMPLVFKEASRGPAKK